MKIIAVLLIGVLLAFNTARAEIKFIPKEGKLWVKASGELLILKSEEAKQEYFALKLEDKNRYILSGEFSNELKKLAGKKVEIDGLLRERIEFGKELIPSIEVKSVKEIAPRGEK
ncbi:MAG: hypothetical protein KKC39_03095 [Candidatus Omnitrophica bacterium]|nr:hypothetical protein [Candidatus Omnitrophota bacterium]MBU4302792.1 hypothetical protein [Candidatus Omnitrophota bacterium]MBU4467717.1 hypothetical protein [Candidatus Omnitrophota bacterium]MCG2708630.1 hypothetical protein [Candidatus Omnitrophota bacterium]